MTLRALKRRVVFAYQRLVRGWDDSDTWSLDYALAKQILPRLRRFRDLRGGGVPSRLLPCDSDKAIELAQAEWLAILDKMIAAFEYCAGEGQWDSFGDPPYVDEGLRLFAEYYRCLWT